MVTVSVNTYQDPTLLAECLSSIRDVIGDCQIQVIDGRYVAHPGRHDNSGDDTRRVCEMYDAVYFADGPFECEADKHYQRIYRAPDGERVLFVDADERLITYNTTDLKDDIVYKVRIHNAACYNGDVRYYPRLFYPEQMSDIPRVDRFYFEGENVKGEKRTDQVTLTHRADLRDEEYKERKETRLTSKGREWYKEYLNEHDPSGLEYETCPECGELSLRVSMVCGYGISNALSVVETCVRADGCYRGVREVTDDSLPESFKYVPDNLSKGFAEDLERVRVELVAAGNPIAPVLNAEALARYEPNAKLWVEEKYDPPV